MLKILQAFERVTLRDGERIMLSCPIECVVEFGEFGQVARVFVPSLPDSDMGDIQVREMNFSQFDREYSFHFVRAW